MLRFWILILLLKFRFIICDLTKDQIATVDLPPKGFGEYFAKIRYLEKCSDFGVTIDPVNANEFKFWATKLNEIDEGVSGYLVVKNDFKVTKGSIFPFTPRNGVMVATLNQTTTAPCKHPLLSFPLKLFLSPDDKCGFKKGNYSITDLNLNNYIHMSTGNNFIYARFHVIIEYFSDVGRTFCIIGILDLRPIPKIRKKKKPRKKKSPVKAH